jgi:hypothetical protein
MILAPTPREFHRRAYAAEIAALANGPITDHPSPPTPEVGIEVANASRDYLHDVLHT